MSIPNVFFDEAGNTGAALLDSTQPVFVLASTNFTDEEAKEIISPLLSAKSEEVKFSAHRRSELGRRRLLDLISCEVLTPERVKSVVTHKRFMVVTKFIDIIEETLMHADGIDLYERGANIALSNLHYFASPVFCGEECFNEFLDSFVEMIRHRSEESKRRFFQAAKNMYDSCSHPDHKSSFAPYIYAERFIDDILDGVTYLALDPAIPSFFSHCTVWGSQLNEQFHAVHDASKPIAAEKATFEAMMDPAIEPQLIGYDRRKFEFPLKANGITFADSRDHPALQLADVIAGSTSYWASCVASGRENGFALDLEAAGIKRFTFDALWPSPHVTPEALGTEESGGVDAVEHVTSSLLQR